MVEWNKVQQTIQLWKFSNSIYETSTLLATVINIAMKKQLLLLSSYYLGNIIAFNNQMYLRVYKKETSSVICQHCFINRKYPFYITGDHRSKDKEGKFRAR